LDVQASKLPKIFRGGSKSLTIPMSYVLDCVICSSNAAASGDLSIMPFNKVPFVISYLKPLTNDKSGSDNAPQVSSVEGTKQGEGEDKLVGNFTLDDVVRLEFEAQWSSARAIFNQIKVILSCCPSRLRDDYVNLRLAPVTASQS
uniref:VPS13_mid_rpt domain-containing protein n=1 Tax=Hymenolepis diminuta TaxID=6216 RepID=A0A0R3SL84_HYMDI